MGKVLSAEELKKLSKEERFSLNKALAEFEKTAG